MSDARSKGWFGAEVSSRSLALLRVLITTTLLFHLISPWVSHRMDDIPVMLIASWVVIGSALCVCLGFKTAITSKTLALGFAIVHLYYGFIHDGGSPRLTEPIWVFLPVVLLAVTPCGRSLSIDRTLEVRRARREGRAAEPERMPAWLLELFVIQLATIWLWGAYDMAESSWLSGARLELYFIDRYGSSDSFALRPGLSAAAGPLAWLGLIAAIGIGVGLLIRPVRAKLAGVALILQCAVMWSYATDWSSPYFHVMMINLLLACAPPEPIHRVITTVIKGPAAARAEGEAHANARPPSTSIWAQPWFAALALGLAALTFNLPPLRAQVLEQPRSIGVWDWRLRDPVRKPICDVRLYDMNSGGAAIERWTLLGHARPREVPAKQAKLRAQQVRQAGVQVCAKLREAGDPSPNVELWARCPAGREWKQVAERGQNVCGSAKGAKP